MKIENQTCSLEQSKKLIELGILPNHATMYWVFDAGMKWKVVSKGYFNEEDDEIDYYPAFTVAELGAAMSGIANGNYSAESFYNWHMGYWEGLITRVNDEKENGRERVMDIEDCDSEAQSRAAMLFYLLKNKHITPEEVNSRLTD